VTRITDVSSNCFTNAPGSNTFVLQEMCFCFL